MYITLTNASDAHKGNKIAINIDIIATVHTSVVTGENGLMESKTFIFCPPHGTWEVSESVDTVVKKLNTLTK